MFFDWISVIRMVWQTENKMIEKEINNRYNEICTNLADRKLKVAFDLLEKMMHDYGVQVFRDEWQNIEQTYHYMLKYTVEGIRDPERQKIYRKLLVSAYELTDSIYEAVRMKFSPTVEYNRKRTMHIQPLAISKELLGMLEDFYLQQELVSLAGNMELRPENQPETHEEHQQKMVGLFNHFWLSDKLSDEEVVFVTQFYQSELIATHYKSFMVSSLVLSLLRHFDEHKFAVLFDLFQLSEAEINQRALVGLVLAFYKYDKRLPFYPAITARLQLLNEEAGFKKNLEQIIVQLIRSRETEKIQRKIRDEIIPEMIKISPTLKDKINLEGLMGLGDEDDRNPDWQEIFKDSPGLMNKMEEFSELQMEGADVFMGSFAMLKMYPFFSEITNWFMPFFINNPQIAKFIGVADEVNQSFIEIINTAPILCNSDKYSFCFSIENLPKANFDFLAQGMNAEISQLVELQKDEQITNPGRFLGVISNQYIQDLYRFYKLHPRKADFEDVFAWRFDFYNQWAIGSILKEDEKILRNIAEYYFRKNYFTETAEIFAYLLSVQKDGELYQKLGYCYQKSGDYKNALETYKKADLFDSNKLWLNNRIALCYRNLKKPQKALEYYLEVEKLDPENLNTELNIGHCYLELGEFEAALKYYFKVEYLAPENKKVWRPLGWCSFVTGKKEQAEKYFQRIIDDEPGKHDLMNMGHVQWCLGNRKSALDFYKRSISPALFSEKEFFEVFGEDMPFLLEQGVEKDDVPIMLDQLRYFVEE